MAGAFDATLKQLLDVCAPDWVGLLAPLVGLPATVAADPLDPDLSVVQPVADKVFRLRAPHRGLLHIEPQSSWDGELPARLLRYNVLLEDRHGGPVYTLAMLLRREADAPNLTGTFTRKFPDGREYVRFGYAVVRVWEFSANLLLASGLGVTPLALLADDAAPQLQKVVNRLAERADREAGSTAAANLLLSCGYILSGLRYDDAVSRAVFAGVQKMRESATYQGILREGRAEGRIEGRAEGRIEGRTEGRTEALQDALLDQLAEKFGTVAPDLETRIRATTDQDRLRAALRQILHITAVTELTL